MAKAKYDYDGRDLLHWPLEKVFGLNGVKHLTVKMDDGIVEGTGASTITSWILWEFHRQYPTAPLLCRHHLQKQRFHSSTPLKHSSIIQFDVYDHLNDPSQMEKLNELGYLISSNLYNIFSTNLESHVVSTSILDYIEIMDEPTVAELHDNAKPNENSLRESRDAIQRHLKSPKVLPNNPMKSMCEIGVNNWGQVLQGITNRGHVTDVDSMFFNKPIMTGYMRGIDKLEDSLMESRSGAKALMAQENPLKITEYFNRRMQLVLQIIRELTLDDCGSTEYVPIRVTGKEAHDGGNFASLEGKYYLTDNGLACLSKKDTHLIGERLHFRSAALCRHRDRYRVCKTCFGELGLSVPPGANLGHWCAAAVCAIISQSVLSTKHLDGAAAMEVMHLNAHRSRYLKVMSGGTAMGLSDRLKNKDITLSIDPKFIKHLEDLSLIDNVDELAVTRMSEIHEIGFIRPSPATGLPIHEPVDVSMGKSPVYLSPELLMHIKKNGWTLGLEGVYQFSLEDFPADAPILTLPRKHRNMLEFQQSVAAFVESTGNVKSPASVLSNMESVSDAVNALLTLVNEKVTVNLAHLEIFILAFMCRDPFNYDGHIPSLNEPATFAKTNQIFKVRSGSATMAYQGQQKWVYDYRSFSCEGRPDHLMDGLLVPRNG